MGALGKGDALGRTNQESPELERTQAKAKPPPSEAEAWGRPLSLGTPSSAGSSACNA